MECVTFQIIDVADTSDFGDDPTCVTITGRAPNGTSVAVHYKDHYAYFYTDLTPNTVTRAVSEFKGTPIYALESVEMHNIIGAVPVTATKITLTAPMFLNKVARKLRGWGGTTYGDNFPYKLRFMVDHGLSGCGWVTVEGGEIMPNFKRTGCDVEYDAVTITPATRPEIAPIVTMSFDIECVGRDDMFPNAEEDPCIMVAAVSRRFGEDAPFRKEVFMVKTPAATGEFTVHAFPTERAMLEAFVEHVHAVDPDILTGYNIKGFDLPYLADRCKRHGVIFDRIARIDGESTEYTNFKGVRQFSAPGRVLMDMLEVMRGDMRDLTSYSLNNVAAVVLKDSKADMPYKLIPEYYESGDPAKLLQLAAYCVKDAVLPLDIAAVRTIIEKNVGMAQVCRVPMEMLFSRGQQIRILTLLFAATRDTDYIIPRYEAEAVDGKFKGATVLAPNPNFYTSPVAVLDFKSLYPSIMQAYNLCYTTWVPPGTPDAVESPVGEWFYPSSVKPGILPEILRDLLDARARTKKEMKTHPKDSPQRAILDGLQLAYKVVCNSVYGFTGAVEKGKLPLLAISTSVTAYGRQMIEITKNYILEHWEGVEVVYGDTDSVMVHFPGQSLRDMMGTAKEMAAAVTGILVAPNELEFEKVYMPYLLTAKKKRYAGIKYDPDQYEGGVVSISGFATVRREYCLFIRNKLKEIIDTLVVEQDVDKAVRLCQESVRDLLEGRVNFNQLIMSNSLSRNPEDYKVKGVHVTLAETIAARDPQKTPKPPVRIPYVFKLVPNRKRSRVRDRGEDPEYALEHDVPLDYQSYVDRFEKAAMTVMAGTKVPPSVLFNPVGKLTIRRAIPKKTAMGKFFKPADSCLGCRRNGVTGVCETCDGAAVATRVVEELRDIEDVYSTLWTQCQRCTGSLVKEVVCGNRDCKIYYDRLVAKKDLERVRLNFDKLM